MKIFKTRDVKSPQRGTSQSAGLDFFVPNDIPIGNINNCIFIGPQESLLIPSGIKANVPAGFALIAMNKSGVSTKKGLVVGACVVDEDYQGEIHLHVINSSNKMVSIEPGEKLMQMLLIPVAYAGIEEVESEANLFDQTTERGSGGFGSTGNK